MSLHRSGFDGSRFERHGRCPLFLASVKTVAEADVALSGGADVIDCKDPGRGALGMLPPDRVAEIVAHVAGRAAVSATVGEFVSSDQARRDAAGERVRQMARTGVDVVKVGLVSGPGIGDLAGLLAEAELRSSHQGLFAVMFADLGAQPRDVDIVATAGFDGVMLDTAGKASGGLRAHQDDGGLRMFVETAHRGGLAAGLAGSLGADDVAAVSVAGADLLGFRGGLCQGAKRQAGLDAGRVAAVRRALDCHACADHSQQAPAGVT